MEQTFGERLRMLRKRKGMTQTDLARAMGVTVQTVVRYEGLRLEEVRPARAEALARALGVSLSELTGEDENAGDDSGEEKIQILARGLRGMDSRQRDNLLRLIMPLVEQYRKEETDPDVEGPAS